MAVKTPFLNTPKQCLALALARLQLSGLDESDFTQLRLYALNAQETVALNPAFRPFPAIKIPYHTTSGRPLSAWPGWPAFYRLRYLLPPPDQLPPTHDGKPPPRYAQEPQSGVCAYFPPLVRWGQIMLDPTEALYVTEGEFKAAKGCREGFATIGLGGVWNFRSTAFGASLIAELEAFTWAKRPVYVVFDSDAARKPQVVTALNELAKTLMTRGAFPYLVTLPDLQANAKTGLDDFLVAEGAKNFERHVQEAEPLTYATRLWAMNEQVVFARRSHLVVDQRNGAKMGHVTFKDAVFANVVGPERVVRPDGSVSLRETSLAPLWLKWPLRAEVEDVTYAPGLPTMVLKDELWWYNTWIGWGCAPRKSSPEPFVQLVNHLFTNAEAEARLWFLQWLAFPLQYPGTKLYSAVVMHGRLHGTGKSLIGYTMKMIYGANFVEIRQADLHANFTEWAENKQFVLGDDVTGSDQRQHADLLKQMITQQEVRINRKYVPSYVLRDCINYYFTSNHPDSFFLEDDDRRYFIQEVVVPPLPDAYYKDYDLWLNTGGAGAVFQYLLDINTEDFNPAARAFRTAARDRMILDSKSDLATWVNRLKVDPHGTLRVGEMVVRGDIMSADELLGIYDPERRKRISAPGLGRELTKAGFKMVNDGKLIRTPNGSHRYYIVRDEVRWSRAALAAVKVYLDILHKSTRFISVPGYEDDERDA